jgi:hypothetical protein
MQKGSYKFAIGGKATSTGELCILSFIIILGALLRSIASQKYIFYDEQVIFNDVINFFNNHTILPTHFNYPTFFSYLVALPTMLNAVLLRFLGAIPDFECIQAIFEVDPLKAILPARAVSAGFGVFTIYLIYILGKHFFDTTTRLVAAVCLAISSEHIKYSSFALPDVAMACFVTASLFFSLRAMHTKSAKDLILGGLFAGLAASTKYNGGMALAPLLLSYLLILRDEKKPLFALQNFIDRRLMLTCFMSLLAFLLASPGWLIATKIFLNAFIYDVNHMTTGHLGAFGPNYFHHLLLFWRADTTLALLFGTGIILAALRRRREDILLLALVLCSYLVIGRWQTKRLHYLLFIYPALALLAGKAVSDIRLRFSHNASWKNLSTSVVILAAVGWPLCYQLALIPHRLKQDNRVIAAQWIQKNIPEGSSIIVDWAYTPKLYTAYQKRMFLYSSGKHRAVFQKYLKNIRTYKLTSLEHEIKYDIIALKENPSQYIVISSGSYDRFFSTPSPPPGNPLYETFQKRKRTYEFLFNYGPPSPWNLLKGFQSGKGPVIQIHQRRIH